MSWLRVTRGDAPLIVSLPHTGTVIPAEFEGDFVSLWRARKDCDWWIERLYDFAAGLGATVIRTDISRSIIDVNRDPSGVSLYPGQATTELCPTTTFDGESLYRDGRSADVAARRVACFEPYHAAIRAEIDRLRAVHPAIVLYDCHSIRSVIPRLFEGELPAFNIGTNSGASCDAALTARVEAIVAETGRGHVVNGRFKGGYITRAYGRPESGVHAIQMELACRGYMPEPVGPVDESNWPSPYDPSYAAPMKATLTDILKAAISFATSHS